jgi:hypothetical protein
MVRNWNLQHGDNSCVLIDPHMQHGDNSCVLIDPHLLRVKSVWLCSTLKSELMCWNSLRGKLLINSISYVLSQVFQFCFSFSAFTLTSIAEAAVFFFKFQEVKRQLKNLIQQLGSGYVTPT